MVRNALTGNNLTWVEADAPDLRTNMAYHLVGSTESGASVSYEATTPPGSVWRNSQKQIYIEGSKVYVAIEGGLFDDGRLTIRLEHEDESTEITPIESELQLKQEHEGLILDFIEAIRAGDRNRDLFPNLPTFDDGMRSLELLLAAVKADRDGGWAKIAEMR